MSIIPNPAPYKPTSLFSHALAPKAANAPLLFDPSSKSTSTEITSQLGKIYQIFYEKVILAQDDPSSDTSYFPLWGGHRPKLLPGVETNSSNKKTSTEASTLLDGTKKSSSAVLTTPSEDLDDVFDDALTPEERNEQLQLKFCEKLFQYSQHTVNLGTAELARKALKAHIKEELKKFKPHPLEIICFFINKKAPDIMIAAIADYFYPYENFIDLVYNYGKKEILYELLKQKFESQTLLNYALQQGYLAVIQWIADFPTKLLVLANQAYQLKNGEFIHDMVHFLAFHGRKDILQWLATHPNRQLRELLLSNDNEGLNIAYHAAKNGDIHILDWMITQPNLEHLITNPTITHNRGSNIAAAALQGNQVDVLNWIICHPNPKVRKLLQQVRKPTAQFDEAFYCSSEKYLRFPIGYHNHNAQYDTRPVNIFIWALNNKHLELIETMLSSTHQEVIVLVKKYLDENNFDTGSLLLDYGEYATNYSSSQDKAFVRYIWMKLANSPNPAYRQAFIRLTKSKHVFRFLLKQADGTDDIEKLLNSPYQDIQHHIKEYRDKDLEPFLNLAHLAYLYGNKKLLELILNHPDEEIRALFFEEVEKELIGKKLTLRNSVYHCAKSLKEQNIIDWLKSHEDPRVRALTVEKSS